MLATAWFTEELLAKAFLLAVLFGAVLLATVLFADVLFAAVRLAAMLCFGGFIFCVVSAWILEGVVSNYEKPRPA